MLDTIVIGGGFFGCMISQHLPGKTLLIEKEKRLLTRASVNNQARVHNGYHYPRSYKTAYSSHKNYSRFISDFKEAIVPGNTMLYPVAYGSKTSPSDFYTMYAKMGCPISVAHGKYKALFNFNKIEQVFEVQEDIFDGDILRNIVKKKISHIETKLNTTVLEVIDNGDSLSVITLVDPDSCMEKRSIEVFRAKRVILAVYASTNEILKKSNIKEVPLIFENTFMPLVMVPPEFKKLGITIMDGDFFSIMPFPMAGWHSIHHVRLTPNSKDFFEFKDDVVKYIPKMKNMKLTGAVKEVKTVLPGNNIDDGRPILYKTNYEGIKGLDIVVGGKIDNIYDIYDRIDGKEDDFLNIV